MNEFNVENVAKVCHEANRAYCQSIGDNSQPSWEEAPDWQRSSAITGVNFHLQNKNTTPADSHNSWLKEKTEQGWKYGEIKNPETKEHPCFVPYNDLPNTQKIKDYIFKSIVDSYKSVFFQKTELTFGEKAVGLTFNPSGDPKVNKAKQLIAEAIDLLEDEAKERSKNNVSRENNIFRTEAFNNLIGAQMSLVKYLTWKD